MSSGTRVRAVLALSVLGAAAASLTAACVATDHGGNGAGGADASAAATPLKAQELIEPAPVAPAAPTPNRKPFFTGNIAAGSYIIPMDVDYEYTGMLTAYGLLDKRLRAGITVSWIIDPNKTAVNTATGTFTTDMTASATDFKSGAVITNHGYRGGPFVVDSSLASQAKPIVTAWQAANTMIPTTVHVATAAFTAPVSRVLNVSPRVAVLNDGNQQIAFSYLNAAGILDENSQTWSNNSVDLLADTAVTGTLGNAQDGALFGNVAGGQPVFCEIMTMHWNVGSTDIPGVTAEMNSFLNYPVHVNAEYQAVNAVEGQPNPDGGTGGNQDWLTTNGYEWPAPKQPTAVQFSNSALPFAQMDGPFATVGGSEPAYGFGTTGSQYYFQDVVMVRGAGVGFGVQDLWMTGYAHGSCDIGTTSPRVGANTCKGKISYLGGHQYNTNVPMSKNPQSEGTRLFLNSLFEAGCVTDEGQPSISLFKSAPTSVSSSSVTYTIDYSNFGPGPALSFVIKDTIPTGSTFVSASAPGTFTGGVVTWALGSLASGGSGQVTFTVTLPAKGTYTNQASSTFKVGNNTLSATSNTVSTVWGSCAMDSDCPPPLVCDTGTSNCVQCTQGEPQNCTGIGICLPSDTCGCSQTGDCPAGDTCVSGKCETCAQSCASRCCAGSTCTAPSACRMRSWRHRVHHVQPGDTRLVHRGRLHLRRRRGVRRGPGVRRRSVRVQRRFGCWRLLQRKHLQSSDAGLLWNRRRGVHGVRSRDLGRMQQRRRVHLRKRRGLRRRPGVRGWPVRVQRDVVSERMLQRQHVRDAVERELRHRRRGVRHVLRKRPVRQRSVHGVHDVVHHRMLRGRYVQPALDRDVRHGRRGVRRVRSDHQRLVHHRRVHVRVRRRMRRGPGLRERRVRVQCRVVSERLLQRQHLHDAVGRRLRHRGVVMRGVLRRRNVPRWRVLGLPGHVHVGLLLGQHVQQPVDHDVRSRRRRLLRVRSDEERLVYAGRMHLRLGGGVHGRADLQRRRVRHPECRWRSRRERQQQRRQQLWWGREHGRRFGIWLRLGVELRKQARFGCELRKRVGRCGLELREQFRCGLELRRGLELQWLELR